MARKDGPRDTSEAFLSLGEELKRRATSPNMYGYEPHEKQNHFHSFGSVFDLRGIKHDIERIMDKTSLQAVRLYIGGNRSGKTVGGIIEDIWWVTKTHPYIDVDAIWPEPIRGRIVTTDYVNGWTKIIRPELARWIPLSLLKGHSWTTAWDKEEKVLSFANGGFIEIMTHEQDLEKFAGASRHFVHFDEECPREIYTECLLRLVDTGGCAWLTMTPVEGMTWTFDVIYEPATEKEEPGYHITEVDMFENPHLTDAERDSIISLLDQDELEARVHGHFVRKGGLIYKDFDKKIHVIEPWIPPKEYLWVVSMDHGLNAPSAWLWHAVNYEGKVITFYEHYQRGWIIPQHAARVKEINRNFNRQPDYYVGDPSIRNKLPNTGVSVFEEYVRLGIVILHQDHLNDVRAGINKVTRYLRTVDVEPDGTESPYWQITKNCEKLIWEMGRYRWRTFRSKAAEADSNPQEQPVKKDDHALDSSRYFFMSRPDLKAIKSQSVSPWDRNLIQSTSVFADERKDIDYGSQQPNTEWAKEYAMSEQTNWQTEEIMGGEW